MAEYIYKNFDLEDHIGIKNLEERKINLLEGQQANCCKLM